MNGKTLKNYARLIFRFGVNLQKGQAVEIICPTNLSKQAEIFTKTAYDMGASLVRIRWNNDAIDRLTYINAPTERLTDVPKWLVMQRDELVKKNSQFIIATHSPILMTFPDAEILRFSQSGIEKVNYKDRFLAFRTRFPAAVSPETLDRVREIGQKIADAFGLKNTPMLVQLLTDDKRESVLEFCARTGGGAKYLLLKKCTGFDPIDAVVKLTLGEPVTVGELKSESKVFTNEFLYAYPGCFDHLEGFEELKQEGILAEYWQFKWKGAQISNAVTSSDRVASITLQADSLEELAEKHKKAAARIKLIDCDGKDMLRHDLLTDIKDLSM